jgi:hypothetical protein
VLDHGDGDMIELLLREGLKTRDRYVPSHADLATISWPTRSPSMTPTTRATE